MRYLIAIFIPWLSFFTMGKVIQGILCLFLQLTMIGWLPATLWALFSVSNYNAEKRADRIARSMGDPQQGFQPSTANSGNTISNLLVAASALGIALILCATLAHYIFFGWSSEPSSGTIAASPKAAVQSPSMGTSAGTPHNCDLLAANPTDERRSPKVPGVQFKEVRANAANAISACLDATRTFPQEDRFRYQLARALQLQDPKAARAILESLVQAKYPAAFDNLGWLNINERNDFNAAIELFRQGYALGNADCAASLVSMIDDGRWKVTDAQSLRAQLLKFASSRGHAGALVASQLAQQAGSGGGLPALTGIFRNNTDCRQGGTIEGKVVKVDFDQQAIVPTHFVVEEATGKRWVINVPEVSGATMPRSDVGLTIDGLQRLLRPTQTVTAGVMSCGNAPILMLDSLRAR